MDGIWLARPDETGAGEPVAVKDLLDTAGLTTTYGSALFAEHVPVASAAVVELLEAAGYAIAGKTNLPSARSFGQTMARFPPSCHCTNMTWA